MMFAPVFTHTATGNRYIITQEDFVSEDRDVAWSIGFGAGLVEAIALQSRHKLGDILEFDPTNLPHVASTLGGLRVAVVAGPIFDEVGLGDPAGPDRPAVAGEPN